MFDLTVVARFIVRDFVFSEDQIEKQREELAAADTTEKELWVCNFLPDIAHQSLTYAPLLD